MLKLSNEDEQVINNIRELIKEERDDEVLFVINKIQDYVDTRDEGIPSTLAGILKVFLDEADNKYYNDQNYIVSDIVYDAVKKLYLTITGQEDFDYVPGTINDDEKKYKHSELVLSLKKYNDRSTLKNELKRYIPFIVEPKYDGLTVVIYPSENDFVAVTRGNGAVGKDITEAIKNLGIIDIQVIQKIKYPIRCEFYVLKSTLELINDYRKKQGLKLYKNSRNAASGILNNDHYDELAKMQYAVNRPLMVCTGYNLLGANDVMSESDQLNTLWRAKFQVPDPHCCCKCNDESQLDEVLKFIDNFNRDALDYDIDGLVIKANYKGSFKAMGGNTVHHPKNAFAWKFVSQGAWTNIESVTWQANRTGKVVPVAEIKPIEILGTTVSRVTLNNLNFIKLTNAKINNEVYVVRSNDVIPAIRKSRHVMGEKDITIPTTCPTCGTTLNNINGQLYCPNLDCQSKILERINLFAHKDALNIEGLSIATIQKMLDAKLIEKPIDLFDLTYEQILSIDGFAEKSAKSLFNKIQNSRQNVTLDKFIFAAGIPNIGYKTAQDIANTIKTFPNLVFDIRRNCQQIREIHGIGDKVCQSLKTYFSHMSELYLKVLPHDMPTNKTNTNLKVCITGKLSFSRNAYQKAIENIGWSFSNSVTKDTNCLIVGEHGKEHSKYDKAKKLGTPLFSEDDFIEKLFKEYLAQGKELNLASV